MNPTDDTLRDERLEEIEGAIIIAEASKPELWAKGADEKTLRKVHAMLKELLAEVHRLRRLAQSGAVTVITDEMEKVALFAWAKIYVSDEPDTCVPALRAALQAFAGERVGGTATTGWPAFEATYGNQIPATPPDAVRAGTIEECARWRNLATGLAAHLEQIELHCQVKTGKIGAAHAHEGKALREGSLKLIALAKSELGLFALHPGEEVPGWVPLAKALFECEGKSVPDAAWFDYQHKAKRLIRLMQDAAMRAVEDRK